MDKNFGGLIWTNHVLDRMRERGIVQGDVWATWSRPDQSRKAKIPGAWIYYRTFGRQKIEVVAKKENGKWIVLSVWSGGVGGTPTKAEPFLSFLFKRIISSLRK